LKEDDLDKEDKENIVFFWQILNQEQFAQFFLFKLRLQLGKEIIYL